MKDKPALPDSGSSLGSLVELIREQAAARPDHPALVFLPDGEVEVGRITYAELDRRAKLFAAQLREQGLEGQTVLLMLPSSIYYVVAFVGCLYAGAVPVPGYPPTNSMHAQRMAHIVEDCDAKGAIVATSSALDTISTRLGQFLPKGLGCALIPIDAASQDEAALDWVEPRLDRSSTAYLQYTSGSTSQPRGVVVTHGNLLNYCESWRQCARVDGQDVFVTWLPLFHDMGLILGVLQALYVGATIVMMPPVAFLQKPLRWLAAISRYRGTVSYAPNFAYELCAAALDQSLINTLDLASWNIAGNAAEPVHADTIARFAARFIHVGYRPEAMNPSYGLAEATLTVTSHPRLERVPSIEVDAEALARGVVQAPAADGRSSVLVSCGRTWLDTEVLVVDPETSIACQDTRVGEIWVRGSLVANGYWRRAEKTAEVFGAKLADGRGPYLRTGDLGVWVDGQLYITGRIKDVIIIRGQNHYPQDIEHTVCRAHEALEVGHGAAFSVTVDHEERLVVVQEVRRSRRHKFDGHEIVRAIRAAVAEAHGLQVHAVQLLRPASVHITSSGKIQRQACRSSFLDHSFEVLHEWREAQAPVPQVQALHAHGVQRTSTEVSAWLRRRIAAMQVVDPGMVDVAAPFSALGLDSLKLMTLSGELAVWLGIAIEPMALYSHSTVEALARHATSGASSAHRPDRELTAAEPVAVVGIACRFPKAGSAPAYWRLLDGGVDAITEIPASRWQGDAHYQPGPPSPGKAYTKWGGFLEEVDCFDAQFFGISPREAAGMDPQQRLLLQTTWHAFEDAGIAPESLAGSDTGVFVGAMTHDYELLEVAQNAPLDAYFGTGTHASILANRISYLFDLRGPSWVAETACSSSLVALHSARMSLQAGECSLAVVGGVNCMLTPELFIALSQAQMLSPDGRCMTFDARANGYVRSEGCAVLIVKRHADAVRDNDRVYGVIRGTAINQDGKSNGITAPNGEAQQDVIRQALAVAGVHASAVSYVEAHGTGTSLGDPIEVDALKRTYGGPSELQPTLWIGSAKTNIGHTEPVSGLAGLTKVLLALQHERLPGNLHFEQLNPHISLHGSRCAVLARPQSWRRGAAPRIAAVSSFGFGGANAHVIVSEAPQMAEPAAAAMDETAPQLLTISAKTPGALKRRARQFVQLLESADDTSASMPPLAALCHTANVHRAHLPQRLAIVGRNRQQMAAALRDYLQHGEHGAVHATSKPAARAQLAFLFTGQGSQYACMGRELYQGHWLFRSLIDQCDAILRPLLNGHSLVDGLYGDEARQFDLGQTQYAQPALFAVEYALAQVWRAAGLVPQCLIGHSLGEYVAACVAGVFSLQDALKLVAHRGRLMQHGTPTGSMVAMRGDAQRLQTLADELLSAAPSDVALAARNTPTDIVVSGEPQAVAAWVARWMDQAPGDGLHATPLRVERAFHSPLMTGMLDEFAAIARSVTYHLPSLEVISNVSGNVAGSELTDPAYWVDHILRPVEFARGMETLAARGCTAFLEAGPHPVLTAFGQQWVGEGTWLPSLRRGMRADEQLLHSLGEWYTQGGQVDWPGWARARSGGTNAAMRPVELPPYPFEQERYWFKPGVAVSREPAVHSLLGSALALADSSDERRFNASLTRQMPWFIDEHRAFDIPVMPMAGFIEAALAAARHSAPDPAPEWTLQDLALTGGLALPEGRMAELQCTVRRTGPAGSCGVAVLARERSGDDTGSSGWSDWRRLAQARAAVTFTSPPPRLDLQALQRTLAEQAVEPFYARAAAIGLSYGPGLQGVKRLWLGESEALARIEMPAGVAGEAAYHLHPATLDACFHVAIPFMEQAIAGRPLALLPTALSRLTVRRRLPAVLWARGTWHGEVAPGRYVADLDIHADDGACLVSVRGMQLALVGRASMTDSRADSADTTVRYYRPQWIALDQDTAVRPAPQAIPAAPADAAARPWIIASPDRHVALDMAAQADALGLRTFAIHAGTGYNAQSGVSAEVAWHAEASWQRCFEDLRAQQLRPAGLIFYGGASVAPAPVLDEVAARAQAVLHACKQFLLTCAELDPSVVICTRGAQVPPEAALLGQRMDDTGLSQCAEVAMAKAITPEFARVQSLQVDLDPDAAAEDVPVAQIFAHLQALHGSGHLAVRAGRWYEARLRELPAGDMPTGNVAMKSNATYLVTGGLRGIGLATAQWLVDRGARSLALLGRTTDPAAEAAVQALQAQGVLVRTFLADVADRATLADVLAQVRSSMPPLRGVFHSAGVTQDRSLATMEWDVLQNVMAPKVRGGWLLHELTLTCELDHFVLFSSLASLAANTGQCNYIAACSFLDALALHRRQRGLAGMSINWGYWSETGLAARSGLDERMAHIGVGGIETGQGMAALERLLKNQPMQCGAAIVDWTRIKSVIFPATPYRLLAELGQQEALNGAPAAAPVTTETNLRVALAPLTAKEARAEVLLYLLHLSARILKLGADGLAVMQSTFATTALNQMGFDSLMAVEMRNRIRADSGADIPLKHFLAGSTAAEVADLILAHTIAEQVTAGVNDDLAPQDLDTITM